MSNNFQEPEEKDMDKNFDTEIVDDFNPLDEPVLEKEYTKHNVRINPNDFKTDIPEPSFTPPPMTGGLAQEEKVKKPEEPFNPKMKEMPNKDKHDAAEKVAEMIMAGYKMLNQYADKRLLFDERKIMKMQMEGDLDLSITIPFNATTVLTAGEFIEDYNQQTKGTIKVTKEFEEETMPVLTRVLAKRGIGMTDEQYLAYLFGKDALQKVFLMNQTLSVKKDILNQLKEATQAMRGGSSAPPPVSPVNNNPQPSPPPPVETYYEPYEEPEMTEMSSRDYKANPSLNTDMGVNDMVNMMTGSTPKNIYQEVDEDYEEPKKKRVKKTLPKKPAGKRGRPKKS